MDWLHIVYRSLGAVVMLFILTRILGKKQISQLTFFEYITGITLGEVAGFISTDLEAHYMLGVAALLVWFFIPYMLEILTLKSRVLRKWFEGSGTVMIKDGKVLEKNLKKERYTADELMELLRTKSVFNVTEVEFAMLEASGDLSVLLKQENRPLTPKHLGIKTTPDHESQIVIIDGKVIQEALVTAGLNRTWLKTELEKIGVIQENVFLGSVDSFGSLYVDVYDDQLKMPVNPERSLLLAQMNKSHADLALYALSANTADDKRMYEHCRQKLSGQIKQLEPLLNR